MHKRTRFLVRHAVTVAMLACGSAGRAAADTGVLQFGAPVFSALEPTNALETKSVSITVTRTDGSSGAVSVVYACWLADGLSSAEAGFYASGTNFYRDVQSAYVQTYGTLSWSNGEAGVKTFSVTLTADAFQKSGGGAVAAPRIEGTKTVQLVLANPGGGATLATNRFAELHILDAQAPRAGVLHFSRPRLFGGEESGSALIPVKRTGGSNGIVSVNYTLNASVPPPPSGVTNLPIAAPGTDYTGVSGTLTWDNGDTADKTFVVPILDDAAAEGPELANLVLRSPAGGAALGTLSNALLTIVDDDRDVINLQMYNYSKAMSSNLRIWFPQNVPHLKGLCVNMGGSGQDTRWVTDYKSDWKAICKEWGFALLGAQIGVFVNYGPQGVGPFFDIMRACGEFTGRPELANAPCMFTGYSLGGIYSAYAAMALPERTIGWAGYRGGDTLYYNTPGLEHVPSLFIAGQNDNNGWVGAPQLRNMFVQWRTNGLPAAYAVAWGVGHVDTVAQDYELAFLYLNEALKVRYPANQVPSKTPGQPLPLNPLVQSNGWLAQTTVHNSPVWWIGIGHCTNFPYDSTTASWLPSEAAAMNFRAFNSLYSSYYPSSFPATKPFQSPDSITTPAAFSLYAAAGDLPVTMDWRSFEVVRKVAFFHDAVKIADDTVSPWTVSLSLTNLAGGPHGLTVSAYEGMVYYYGFQLFTIQTPDPCRRPSRLVAGAVDSTTLVLAWQDNSGDETGFMIDRCSGMPEAWSNVAQVAAGVVGWTDSNVVPGQAYLYRVAAFNAVGVSGYADPAAVMPSGNTWSGAGGNAGWDTPGNWLGGAVPGNGANAVFPEKDVLSPYTSGRTITLPGPRAVGVVNFRNNRVPTGDLIIGVTGTATLAIGNGGGISKPCGDATNTISCGVEIGTNALVCDIAAGSVTLAGGVSGPGGLAKYGAGTLVLAGSNTYAGSTLVSGGTLLVNNRQGSGCGAGLVLIGNGGTLGGNGFISGTVADYGALAPGLSTGTLTVGTLLLEPTSTLNFEVGDVTKAYDRVVVNGSLTLAGSLNISNLIAQAYGTYTLITYAGALTNNGLALGELPAGYDALLLTNAPGKVEVQLTPEPAALLALIAAALLAGRGLRARAAVHRRNL